jgi:hypothetical protein
MEEICSEKDNGLTFQDAKIKDLRSRISKQKQIHKQLVANFDIELKQGHSPTSRRTGLM